jgi:hypothetical protein
MKSAKRQAPRGGQVWNGAWLIAVGLSGWLAAPIGCGDDEVCTPGEQVGCACPGGVDGAQSCNAEGSGFEACDCEGTGPGAGGGPGSTASSATSGGAGPASSTASGPMGCDGKGVCEDTDDDANNDCVGCVLDGTVCEAALMACINSPDCVGFIQCFDDCPDPPMQPCIDACAADQPAGAQAFQPVASCICGQCTSDCSGSPYCG